MKSETASGAMDAYEDAKRNVNRDAHMFLGV